MSTATTFTLELADGTPARAAGRPRSLEEVPRLQICRAWNPMTTDDHAHEHAGGDEALHRLEEIFYDKVLADPVLKTLFNERRPHHVEHLTWFTGESLGRP